MLFYTNKKGKEVLLKITPHAWSRFIERYNLVFPDDPIFEPDDVNKKIKEWWFQSVLYEPKKGQLKQRLKKHGTSTLYFKSSMFLFVVNNSTVVTIELSSKDNKHLNKPCS